MTYLANLIDSKFKGCEIMDDFIAGLFIGGISCFSVWMLANGNVYPDSFNFANKVCESHQGLKYLDEDKTKFSKAFCNDGVSISYDNSEIKGDEK